MAANNKSPMAPAIKKASRSGLVLGIFILVLCIFLLALLGIFHASTLGVPWPEIFNTVVALLAAIAYIVYSRKLKQSSSKSDATGNLTILIVISAVLLGDDIVTGFLAHKVPFGIFGVLGLGALIYFGLVNSKVSAS